MMTNRVNVSRQQEVFHVVAEAVSSRVVADVMVDRMKFFSHVRNYWRRDGEFHFLINCVEAARTEFGVSVT